MSLLLQTYSEGYAGLNVAATAKDKNDDLHVAIFLTTTIWDGWLF
jgi:hypothetical protein